MKKIMIILVMVAAFVLPTLAQFGQEEQPQVQFQSTSTMQVSGSSLASQPMLNADGTAAYSPAASSSPAKTPGVRKSRESGEGEVDTPTGGVKQPLGDALLPLALMAMMYIGVIYLRKRKIAHGDAQHK